MGLFYVEIEGLSSLELMFDQRVDKLLNLQRKNKLRRVNKIVQKHKHFFFKSLSLTATVRECKSLEKELHNYLPSIVLPLKYY